jgi:hypothetical protein
MPLLRSAIATGALGRDVPNAVRIAGSWLDDGRSEARRWRVSNILRLGRNPSFVKIAPGRAFDRISLAGKKA